MSTIVHRLVSTHIIFLFLLSGKGGSYYIGNPEEAGTTRRLSGGKNLFCGSEGLRKLP